MTEVEETLRRTFGQAADQAPRLPPLLPERLEQLHRRKRGRVRMTLAAAAVVLIGGGTVAVVRGGDTITAVPAAESFSAKPPASVEKVWPQAVTKIPAKGPGGLGWQPVALVGDRTPLMVTSTAETGAAVAVYAYDLDKGVHQKIATMPEPGQHGFAGGFAVGSGHVAWWSGTKDRVAQLWSVPVSGGKPKLVGSQSIKEGDGSGIDKLAVAGDQIVFSLYTGGVFTVPLAGGTVTPVEGGAGMHLLAWPWIGTPGQGGEPHGTEYARILNVETGETRGAVTHPGENLRFCGVTICLGRTTKGGSFFRHRDGSGYKAAPGNAVLTSPPVQDRFYPSPYGDRRPAGVGLYDLDTGASGDLGLRPDGQWIAVPSTDPSSLLLSYQLGDQLHLIDLTQIR
ncbi:hypothetical protein GCM10022419_087760 [Nonomuraea rosea]|uniref:WD40 repeat domain-containing protein n=1 Tax=Nonomuraea rosea TaxID=638574 RepID=A0ABP6YWK1_9ACTN